MNYDPHFYAAIRSGCQQSADLVVEALYSSLLGSPSTVVDVGGGEGWWAAAFEDCGAEAVLVENSLVAPVHKGTWQRLDLELPDVSIDGEYELAVCLEVAEHLDDPDHLLDELCRVAPLILFSAAIPGQAGAHHVSCLWQSEWAALFGDRGFGCRQLLYEFWGDERIEPWYRQNMMIVGRDVPMGQVILDVVHPEIWMWK